jgi:PKD repeat protein
MKKILSMMIIILLVFAGLGTVGMSHNNTMVKICEKNTSLLLNETFLSPNLPQIEGKIGSRYWSIVATYTIPEGASGLASDGTYLYCGIYGANGDEIYQIDPETGDYSLLFSGPQDDAYGLTFDGEYLWTTDHPGSSSTPAIAMQMDMDGNLISQFNLPDHYMSGIAYDNGDFWVSTYYPEPAMIYKVAPPGTILQQFSAPDDQPWDLCLENENLWMADYWGDTLYKIDPSTGYLLESHPSEGVDPAGIVWDGTYLWYCDNGLDYNYDYLYKVALKEGTMTADFTADVTEGEAPLTVHFTDLSTAENTTVTSWKWDFNNDTIIDSEEQHPIYTYSEGGTYTVSLTISDGTISDTETKVNYITVLQGELAIGDITGGLLKVDAEIKNVGDTTLTDVNWSITLDGGLILLGKEKSGNLTSIAGNETKIGSDKPVFGFGKVQIHVVAETPTVSPASKTVNAFVILFFVKVL